MISKTDNEKSELFSTKRRKKNDYVRLEAGAYPRRFLQQLKDARTALQDDNLDATKMVRRDERSGAILITMGFWKRNTWFENRHIPKGEVAVCEDADEALKAIQALIKYARAGEFDEALEKLRIKRQEHADTMIKVRDVCGFHRKVARDPVKLLEGPNKVAK